MESFAIYKRGSNIRVIETKQCIYDNREIGKVQKSDRRLEKRSYRKYMQILSRKLIVSKEILIVSFLRHYLVMTESYFFPHSRCPPYIIIHLFLHNGLLITHCCLMLWDFLVHTYPWVQIAKDCRWAFRLQLLPSKISYAFKSLVLQRKPLAVGYRQYHTNLRRNKKRLHRQ